MSLWEDPDFRSTAPSTGVADGIWDLDVNGDLEVQTAAIQIDTVWELDVNGDAMPGSAADPFTTYNEIMANRNSPSNVNGGLPHRFIELSGGWIIEMLYDEPDPLSYKYKFYYSTIDNNLYIKSANWIPINAQIDSDGDDYVMVNGRQIKKLMSKPDPYTYNDGYYYDIKSAILYKRAIRWARHTDDK